MLDVLISVLHSPAWALVAVLTVVVLGVMVTLIREERRDRAEAERLLAQVGSLREAFEQCRKDASCSGQNSSDCSHK